MHSVHDTPLLSLCDVIHCQCDRSYALAVSFGGALTFVPSLAQPLWVEHTQSIALVVRSGAPICGFVTSALHKHVHQSCSASYATFHLANSVHCVMLRTQYA